MKKQLGFGQAIKMALCVLLVFLMFVLSALAGSSTLHHLLHSDSDSAAHHCLVTVFADSQLAGAETMAAVALVSLVVIYAAQLPDIAPRPHFDYSSAPSRAPPRF
jgi:hypothetical protein